MQRVVDGETVRSLALSGRNYLELASLIPGAITTDDDQMATMTGLGTGGASSTATAATASNLTVDGGFNLDSGSNASMINNVSIDFIDQVAIQTSNFAADKGRNAGASINVVTRSGTNRFSGGLMETFRDDKFHSANYFAPRDRRQPDQGQGRLQQLRRRPRRSDRQEQAVLLHRHGVPPLDRQESPQRRTLPTRAELQETSPRGFSVPTASPAPTTTTTFPIRSGTRPPACRSPTTRFRRACSPRTAARSRASTTG